MDFYFAPLACSLATRIAVIESGASVRFIYVDIHTDPRTRRLADGSDYYSINPMGQVPAIRTDDGELLTENAVVLQYVADLAPDSGLAPGEQRERYRLQSWLNFIATELHKATYIPLLDRHSSDEVKAYGRKKLALRFGHLSQHLAQREYLLPRFSIADCYLFAVLNWSPYAGIDLSTWPVLSGYSQRLRCRPSVAQALVDEQALFAEEQQRMREAAAVPVVSS